MSDQNSTPKNAPMASAPFVYNDDGSVAWDQMWTTYCALASEGGPPHRGTVLTHAEKNDTQSESYKKAASEIVRGVNLITPYKIPSTDNGWLHIQLTSPNMAKWFSQIINSENVECKYQGKTILLPINDSFTIAEIKNVITVMGKAHHYWKNHRSWFAKIMIHLTGNDWEKGLWE